MIGVQDCKIRHKYKAFISQYCGLWVFFLWGGFSAHAQITIDAEVLFSPVTRTLTVEQRLTYQNTSSDTLNTLYFRDWLNAFNEKQSPLGQRFASQFSKQFHFSNTDERGGTHLDFIRTHTGNLLLWQRPKENPDWIKIELDTPMLPNETRQFQLRYTTRIPLASFTGYGRQADGQYDLRYWLISPVVYKKGWMVYSNQDLNDSYLPPMQVNISIDYPQNYKLYSGLNQRELTDKFYQNRTQLSGVERSDFQMVLTAVDTFDVFELNDLKIVSQLSSKALSKEARQVSAERITNFLKERLGVYPFKKILLTQADYKSSPVYGLNQLPDFLRPFSDEFQFDMKLLKTMARKYIKNSMLVNPRQDAWITQAIVIDLMMDYVNRYYPETHLIGKLSKLIGLRWSHLAELPFNYRYSFLFMNMNRANLDQPLAMPQDSLIRFNQEIANPFKAGLGFAYLEDYIGAANLHRAIQLYFQQYKLRSSTPDDFKTILQAQTDKPINWFFEQFVATNYRIDYTIDAVTKISADSLEVVVKSKTPARMPISLYGLNRDDQIVAKYWLNPQGKYSKIRIPSHHLRRLVLNYEGVIPEINRRNNTKNLQGIFNKPLQLRLFKDFEDPNYTQFFVMPEFAYDLYDGLTIGTRVSNEAVLPKPFKYHITPQYGLRSKALIGKLSLQYKDQYRNRNLESATYGFSGNRYSYAHDLFYYRFSPYVIFKWRHRDLRNRERQYLTLRNVSVLRDQSALTDVSDSPDYSVFDLQYTYSNSSLISTYASTVDYQLAENFSKLALTAKYRKLFLNNWQIEFRLFAGIFLFNHTNPDSHYFSFALDRPSDYLFDYNYYGRSEDSGLFSQQFIESEGGFKSKLEPAFANRWLTTLNVNASLWRDVLFLYGDVGLIKNHGVPVQFRYDSGVRLSLVQNYFELFFPVYSSLGWEVSMPNYEQRIRFIVTLDFNTLMGLFKRSYY